MNDKGTDKFNLRTLSGVFACLERVANGVLDGSMKLQEARVHGRLVAQALRALTLRRIPARRAQAADPEPPPPSREPTFEERVRAMRGKNPGRT